MPNNKLIIAAAGSGKTTTLVKKALEQKDGRVLITTYTRANEAEIKKKILELNKCIPANVTVQTWFSFLLQHGVRPFQPVMYDGKIRGLLLVNNQSGLKYRTAKGIPVYYREDGEFEQHYFTNDKKIYSDKLSKFVIKCDKKSEGAVIDRLSRIYTDIFIDEVQDLAGFDLEVLKLLFERSTQILLVGDPRQGTYSTNTTQKNKQFRKSEIVSFFDEEIADIQKDDTSLLINYRCNQPICDLSNKIFSNYTATTSGNEKITSHDGIFFVKPKDVQIYIDRFNPVQLRDSVRTEVNTHYNVMNFGESKGLSFDRVLIYPTDPIRKWLEDNSKELAPTSKSKLYVAITRARHSVAFVCKTDKVQTVEGISVFCPD